MLNNNLDIKELKLIEILLNTAQTEEISGYKIIDNTIVNYVDVLRKVEYLKQQEEIRYN